MTEEKRVTKDQTKRKPPWILGALVFGLLLFLFLLQSSNVWKSVTVSSSGETLLLYALSSLNFVAFVIFALILARSLLKLRQERRALQLGSKLKTRLLIYFAGVSLLPLIAMAVFSYLFMNRALERWFTQMPENVVRKAGKLQIDTLEDQKNKSNQTAQIIARLLNKTGTEPALLDELRTVGNLAALEVIDQNNRTVYSSRANLNEESEKDLLQIKEIVNKGDFDNLLLSDGNGFDVAIAELDNGRKLLIIPSAGPEGNIGELVNSSLNEFDRLKASQSFVRQLGLTTVGLLTFLLIFAASWAAFYVAKGLTRPIRALAEGADEIARGNFSHRVEVIAEDELELLVRAFNTMTGTLEANSAELDERRKYIETILQSLSTGVISFDSEDHVTTINKAAIDMLRLEPGDFVGFELGQLVEPQNRLIFEKLIARAGRIGYSTEQSVLFRENTDTGNKSNDEVTVALAASKLPDNGGTVVVIEDLSELLLAQRAAAWQEVARRMAHEIKNPLTPIQLSAERIAKRFANGANGNAGADENPSRSAVIISEGTDTILREVESLKSMVDEFSRFARLPDADKREISVVDIIRQSAALYEGRQSTDVIKLSLDDGIPLLFADGEHLKRVFVNLIDNAIESFDENQENNSLSITALYEKHREIVRIEFADTGVGINPANINKLFQPYFSTKGRGTGLGLAIVHRIVRDHQGSIKASRNGTQGSKFTIELPIYSTDD